MGKPKFDDMMRVTVRDADGHLVRVLDLAIKHDWGSAWGPAVDRR
jgi:hypothetical protein